MHRVAYWIGTTGPGVNLSRHAIAVECAYPCTRLPTCILARHAMRPALRWRSGTAAAHSRTRSYAAADTVGDSAPSTLTRRATYQYAAPVPTKADAQNGAGRRGRVTQRAVIGQRGDDQRATHLGPSVKVSAADATANSAASHAKAMASRACILCRAPTPLTHASSAVRCNVPDGAHAASLATRTGAGPHGPPEARACAGRLGVARRMWLVTTAPPYRTVESWRK